MKVAKHTELIIRYADTSWEARLDVENISVALAYTLFDYGAIIFDRSEHKHFEDISHNDDVFTEIRCLCLAPVDQPQVAPSVFKLLYLSNSSAELHKQRVVRYPHSPVDKTRIRLIVLTVIYDSLTYTIYLPASVSQGRYGAVPLHRELCHSVRGDVK